MEISSPESADAEHRFQASQVIGGSLDEGHANEIAKAKMGIKRWDVDITAHHARARA